MSVTVFLGRSSNVSLAAFAVLIASGCASTSSFDDLPPIDLGARELRVHVHEFNVLNPAFSHAYFMRPGLIVRYSYDGSRWESRRAATASADEMLDAAADLARLNGRRLGCGYDGNRIEIEGVIEGQRFSFVASSPEGCTDEDSQQLAMLLESIGREAH